MADDREPRTDLRFGDYSVDRRDERLVGPAGPVRLGRKAFRFLIELAELDGRLLTKDRLMSSVWDGTVVSEAALTSVVKELRRALGDDSREPRYIETVYGRGFRLLTPVSHEDKGPAPPPPVASPAPPPKPGGLGAPPVLIVAPFTGQGGAGDHPDVAAQLREEVLAGLSRFRELQLIAGARAENQAPPRSGGPAYLLSAMALPQGEGGKLIARLQRLGDGVVVWTESMEFPGPLAAGAERIVRRIVGAAAPVVDEDVFLEGGGEAGSVHQSYLTAKWASLHARTGEEAAEAMRALEAVIAAHPGFALAYPPLVRLYNTDYGYTALGSTGAAERARALALAKQGLAADRGNAHAHSVLGFCHLWQGDLRLARSCFERSLQLNPYSHVRAQEAATAFMHMGDPAAARALMERAAELNPTPDDDYAEDLGRLLLIEGEPEAARESLRSLLTGSIWAEMYLSTCELQLGLTDGRERMAAWTARVGRCWRTGAPPDAPELVRWVRLHHPQPASGDGWFAVAATAIEGLGAPTSATSASR